MYPERKKEREMACLVPGIRQWIMKIKNDQLSILEKEKLMASETQHQKKKKEKLMVSETQHQKKKRKINGR